MWSYLNGSSLVECSQEARQDKTRDIIYNKRQVMYDQHDQLSAWLTPMRQEQWRGKKDEMTGCRTGSKTKEAITPPVTNGTYLDKSAIHYEFHPIDRNACLVRCMKTRT